MINLFKRKKKEKIPVVSKVIGIYTAQCKGVPVMRTIPDDEAKYPHVLEVLNHHHSVHIVEDVNDEYFKVISRYQPNKFGYVRKNSGSYIMCIALPYCVIVKDNQKFVVYNSPNEKDESHAVTYKPGERLVIETEWDNYGKIYDENYWVNLDTVDRLRY